MSDSGKSSTASEATGTSKSDAKTTNKSDEKPRQPAEELLDSEPANSDELLKQARDFLTSPSVRHQDVAMKRDFLAKKGVSNDDIERLLVETDAPPPLPPRTYLPPAPPSQLPQLIQSAARAVGVFSLASGVALWIYQTSIFPRLSDSFAARHAIRMHQLELAREVTARLHALRDTIAPVPAIRVSEDGEEKVEGEKDEPQEWEDAEPILDVAELPRGRPDWNALPASLDALTTLASSHPTNPNSTSFQSLSITSDRTLNALTDLSAYLTSETYKIPNASSFRLSTASTANSRALGPMEEEVRREMKALKGLVLNRRSFAAGTPSAAGS